MKKLRIWAAVSLTLSILGLVLLFLMHLALTDISHGEEDVSLEWTILRLGFLVIFFLIVATFICASLVLKHFRDRLGAEAEERPWPAGDPLRGTRR